MNGASLSVQNSCKDGVWMGSVYKNTNSLKNALTTPYHCIVQLCGEELSLLDMAIIFFNGLPFIHGVQQLTMSFHPQSKKESKQSFSWLLGIIFHLNH